MATKNMKCRCRNQASYVAENKLATCEAHKQLLAATHDGVIEMEPWHPFWVDEPIPICEFTDDPEQGTEQYSYQLREAAGI